jgi:predicted metal-dependent hydrolase
MIAPMSSARALLKAGDDPPVIEVEGQRVPVAVRVNARARRLTLRMAPGKAAGGGDGVALTLPPGVELEEGLAFVERSRGWIAARLRRLPAAVPFADGHRIPILGEEHLIKHAPWSRRPAWVERYGEGGILWIGGKPEHLARRVTDHLTALARKEISGRARAKADRLPELYGQSTGGTRGFADLFARLEEAAPEGAASEEADDDWAKDEWGDLPARGARHAALDEIRPPGIRSLGRITLRDTRTRWGSCSHRGDLNFSWRLVFAPRPVLDYVVAHEVAHLAHLDHSPAFWRLCDALTEEPGWTKAWLKRNGQALLRYGV